MEAFSVFENYITGAQLLQWTIIIFNILVETFVFYLNVRQFKVFKAAKWEGMEELVKDICPKEAFEKALAYRRESLTYLGFGFQIYCLLILYIEVFDPVENVLRISYLVKVGYLSFLFDWFLLQLKHGVLKLELRRGFLFLMKILAIFTLGDWAFTFVRYQIIKNLFKIDPPKPKELWHPILPQNTTCISEFDESFSIALVPCLVSVLIFGSIKLIWSFEPLSPILFYFFKLRPFKAGPLKTKIEELANKLGFPVAKIQVEESDSRYSNASCNYLTGRIVFEGPWINGKYEKKKLSENIGKEEKEKIIWNDEDILGILAHELGHWKFNHHLPNLIIAHFLMLVLSYLGPSVLSNSASVKLFWIPILKVVFFISMRFSQEDEYEADAFAVDEGYGYMLKQCLINFAKENPPWFPVEDTLYSKFYSTHPTHLQRIQAIESRIQKQK